jgi:hypothetical protein
MQESQKEQKQKNNLSPLLITPLYDLTTTTLQSFKCSHIIVYSTSPCSSSQIIRPLSSKDTPLIGSNFIYTEINTTKLSPSREDTFTLQNEWSYKRGSTVYYYMGTFEAL